MKKGDRVEPSADLVCFRPELSGARGRVLGVDKADGFTTVKWDSLSRTYEITSDLVVAAK